MGKMSHVILLMFGEFNFDILKNKENSRNMNVIHKVPKVFQRFKKAFSFHKTLKENGFKDRFEFFFIKSAFLEWTFYTRS